MSADSFALSGFLTAQDAAQFGALGAGSGPGGLPPNHPSIPPKLRKRTKTGCLTCRKRRIKCGEERPTCNNCVKSKRHCEGYAQRIHFKPPFADWPNAAQSPTGQDYPPDFLAFDGPTQAFTAHRHVPPPISTQFDGSSNFGPQTGYLVDSKGQLLAFSAATPTQPNSYFPEPQSAPPHMQTHPIHSTGLMGPPQLDPRAYSQRVAHSGPPMGSQNFAYQAPPLQSPPLVEHITPFAPFSPGPLLTPEAHQAQNEFFTTQPFTPLSMPLGSGPPTTTTQSTSADNFAWASSDGRRPSLWSATSDGSFALASPQVFVDHQGRQAQAMFGASNMNHSIPFTNSLHAYAYAQPLSGAPSLGFPLLTAGTTQILDDAAVEHEDDDYYDIQSDEEIEDVTTTFSSPERSQMVQQTLSAIMRLHQGDLNELTMRTYNDFIQGGILDYYRAERTANPLRNPMTARVFAHFITATGPTMSMFERLPRNASALIDDDQGGTQQQHSFWTYTLPAMALNNQVVLHAMLALSSLHIAKLQGASITPSYKHYAYSLKRLRKCLGHPSKRHLATTLAATLILGFYEVLTADHLKWNSHLMGASLLASEIDLRAMTREARRLRRDTSRTESSAAWRVDSPPPRHDDLADVDENLISTLSGMKVDFDGDSHFTDPTDPSSRVSSGFVPRSMDLNQYNVYQDLVWWYLKQDLYQSIISGNPLLFSYQRWTDCPPRAVINRHDAVYGTFDHCILILGRIADFSVRDRKRKIQVITKNGGQWRPHPSMTMPKPPTQGGPPNQAGPPKSGGPQQPGAAPPQPPPFYGMAPTPSKVQVPASFASHSHGQSLPAPAPSPEGNLDELTAAALQEWTSIRTALAYFEKSLGPAFQPLPEEFAHHQSLDPTNSQAQDPRTIFGAVIQYQSYDIAVLWAFIHMAYIILIRSHPYMPPAAMMAAGIAAKQTAPHAQKIGQIAIGIVPPPHDIPLNPSIGATLCEVSIPLFFAGIQYQAPQQRDWLVSRIRHVERRTGWASVGMIAFGCETAWRKAAEMGRGPPYSRKEEVIEVGILSSDDRIRKRGEIITELGINTPQEASAVGSPNRQIRQVQGQLSFDFNAPMQANDLGMGLGAMNMGGLQGRMSSHLKGKQPLLEDESNPNVNLAERRYIHVNLPTRLHWAMGILSEQEDV